MERERKRSSIIKNILAEEAQAVLLGIPHDKGSSGFLGSASAPRLICDALHYDVEEREDYLGVRVCDEVKIVERHLSHVRDLEPEDMARIVKDATGAHLNMGLFVATIGGSHSVSIGAIHSHKTQIRDDFTVVQLDAHLDLRPHDEDFLTGIPDPYAHCCVMRHVHQMGIPFVQAGIRVRSDIEMDFLLENGLEKNVFRAGRNQDLDRDIIKAINTDKVYVSLDIDVLDKSQIIATGTPENRGWTWQKLYQFLDHLMKHKNLIGIDIVEVCPENFGNIGLQACYEAGQLIYWTIGRKFCK